MSILRVIPLGGLGEIGLNMMALECDGDILLIDAGVLFPDLYWMGLDIIHPDFSFVLQNEAKIKGLVVTHGHEDHIGAIPYLLKQIQVPIIYCSRFAARLIEDKCKEHGVDDHLQIHKIDSGDRVDIGCFEVEFVHVTHSTLQSFALGIRTPAGLVVHSGDFKFDEKPYRGPPSDKKRLKELGGEKPLLLLSDSTNSERHGHSQSESSINAELKKLVGEAQGAVVVALFASNVHRIHQLIDIAVHHKRKVFLSGRSMVRYVQFAVEENFLPVDLSSLRPLEEIGDYDRSEVLVLSTGSQGEARSSLLRLARNENPWMKIQKDDVVILSSRNIPGNERAISYVVNQLYKLGAQVHYEDLQHVHVSGHAYKNEQMELLKLIQPRFFIPIHGEYRHLSLHAQTARESGVLPTHTFIIENGQVWQFDSETAEGRLGEVVSTGRNWHFDDAFGTLEDAPIKERRSVARAGVVVVDCLTTARAEKLLNLPAVTLKGFLCSKKKQEIIKGIIERQTAEAFQAWRSDNPDGFTKEQAVGATARKAVRKVLDVKPLVIVNFLCVNERAD